jgi:hypothetical protein
MIQQPVQIHWNGCECLDWMPSPFIQLGIHLGLRQ